MARQHYLARSNRYRRNEAPAGIPSAPGRTETYKKLLDEAKPKNTGRSRARRFMTAVDLQPIFRDLTPQTQLKNCSRTYRQAKPRVIRTCRSEQSTLARATSSVIQPSRHSDVAAVVIVDHGSRRRESNEQLEAFAEMYRRAHPERLVLAAHMELAEPSIRSAIGTCAEAGCSRVVVAPYFLSQGRHIQQDIPALVTEAQTAFPDVSCTIAEPIGLDEAMVGIIGSRVMVALEGAS